MYDEQTVLVLSGTSDSGRAVAETVADAGGTVGFTYNSASDDAEALLNELDGDGHEAWSCDVTDPRKPKRSSTRRSTRSDRSTAWCTPSASSPEVRSRTPTSTTGSATSTST